MSKIAYIDKSVLSSKGYIYVFGLNIFRANEVDVDLYDDPRIIFMREIVNSCVSMAHIGANGMEDLYDDDLGEYLSNCIPTTVNVHDGNIYRSSPGIRVAYFMSHVNDMINDISMLETVEYLIRRTSLTLLANLHCEAKNVPETLSMANFIDKDNWITSCLQLCDYIIMPVGDGWYFEIYLHQETSTDILESALSVAIDSIRQNTWFQQNEASLVWDNESDLCLKLTV